MTPLYIPPEPPPLGANPADTQITQFNTRVDILNRALYGNASQVAWEASAARDAERILASKAHAQAQADTAVAMDKAAVAQLLMVEAVKAPYPEPADSQHVLDIVKNLASAGVSGLAAVNAAKQTMGVFRLIYPRS